MFVKKLTIYPLAGARGIDVEHAELCGNGMFRNGDTVDREFVCYDPETKKRVSSKHDSNFALLFARKTGYGTLAVCKFNPDNPLVRAAEKEMRVYNNGSMYQWADLNVEKIIDIDEFGEMVPMSDLGDSAARSMSDLLDREVRIAQKVFERRLNKIPPKDKKVAPLHLVSWQAIESAIRMSANGYDNERYVSGHSVEEVYKQVRAGMLIDTGESAFDTPMFPEMSWQPGVVLASKARTNGAEIIRQCVRCAVPGIHPWGGQRDAETDISEKSLKETLMQVVPRGKNIGEKESVFGQYARSSSDMAVVRLEVGQALHPFGAFRPFGDVRS
jgi:uncharacterized protein YcbX